MEEQDIRTELSSDQGFVYKQNEYGLNFVLQYKVHRKREVWIYYSSRQGGMTSPTYVLDDIPLERRKIFREDSMTTN